MADLIAIGYPDEATAERVERAFAEMRDGPSIEPDAMAVILRDGDGTYRVQTSHHPVSSHSTWGMLWAALFGFLFFTPVLGMAVGAGLGDLTERLRAMGIDEAFQEQARDILQPGTSALFAFVDGDEGTALEALSSFGGTTIVTSLSASAHADLQDHLHGDPGPLP